MKKIEKIPEGNPFKIPENYFEKVNREILSSTVESKPVIKQRALYRRFRPFILAAASVAVLALLTYTGIKFFSGGNDLQTLSKITIEDYSELILEDIDFTALEESAAAAGLPYAEPPVYKSDIIEYLLLENIDINLLEEQL
jgi:hypothetical protein